MEKIKILSSECGCGLKLTSFENSIFARNFLPDFAKRFSENSLLFIRVDGKIAHGTAAKLPKCSQFFHREKEAALVWDLEAGEI